MLCVRVCRICLGDRHGVLLFNVERGEQISWSTFIYIVGNVALDVDGRWRRQLLPLTLFFLAILRQRHLFLSLILSTLSGPAAVSFKTLDPRVALAEKCFKLYVGCPGGGELTPKGRPRKNRIRCIGGLFPCCGRKKDVEL